MELDWSFANRMDTKYHSFLLDSQADATGQSSAAGVEIEHADGAGQFESVMLRPHAKLAAGSDENIARRLHDAAAKKCFIARSVSFKVEHEPTFEIASA
jgi:organic hydroperoxide reductase OsmC/OhrA